MTQSDPPAAQQNGTLEALQNQTGHSRRLRPPDLELVMSGHNRVPLKPDAKLQRRESKIGLRGFFGRSRGAKDTDSLPSPRESSKPPGGIRSSWVDISGWSYGLQAQRSEITLPPIADATTPESASSHSSRQQKKSPVPAKRPPPATPGKAARGSLAAWDPPPLFQAYPQAIRHAHLPACTHSAEAILRMSDKKIVRDDLYQSALDDMNRVADKRKKHRRNLSDALEWTTKVYVLVTSGYLLQYAGDGSFDRLPERILHLGKDSAAFASDVIPGRHWVLQVASMMEPSGTPTPDSRSLFSRLPFRPTEKRPASNFLMVFESAEDMDVWISVLRREIEALGGKKNLSETGKPKIDDNASQLKAQPSQRALVVRDPGRFSRVLSPQDVSWRQSGPGTPRDPESGTTSVTVVDSDMTPEQSMDDVSATNSIISHDGRQLENLRDSTGANRLSFISSGQRTIVTSPGSSPACSPTRDSFASIVEDLPPLEPLQEARPRPNAAAIADRRQSMQAMSPFIDPKSSNTLRPHSIYGTAPGAESNAAYGYTTPNFSVPHSVSRRYSLARPPPPPETSTFSSPPISDQPSQSLHPPRSSSRRCPPTTLMLSRPLSIVADQPSPIQELDIPQSSPATEHSESPTPEEPTIVVNVSPPPPSPPTASFEAAIDIASPIEADDITSERLAVQHSSPRKATSLQTLRDLTDRDLAPRETVPAPIDLPSAILTPPRNPASRVSIEEIRRCQSSMAHYGRSRSRSPSTKTSRKAKRASLQTLNASPPDKRANRFSVASAHELSTRGRRLSFGRSTPSKPLAPFSGPTPSVNASPQAGAGLLGVDVQSKALFNRRSMPQLADGPPPAPPPTCALPPIPQKIRVET